MVYFEHTGDNDFRSIFESVRQEDEERKEREQAERLLSILGDLEAKQESAAVPAHGRPRRELMRVSITDSDKANRDNELEESRRTARREAAVQRVHTLDDLPKEDIFGFPVLAAEEADPLAAALDVQIIPGRRVHDGAVAYHANFPLYTEYMEAYGEIQMEHVLFGFLVLFLIGVYFGSRAVRRARTASAPAKVVEAAPVVHMAAAMPQPLAYDALSGRLGALEHQIALLVARR